MKFALVDGNKVEATKGARGICPICSSELIAKCGEIRINHWAHKSKSNCDRWWESETEWHRSWKNNFPVEWQEITLSDERTDERHIADIRTMHGLVIEFQHSHIDSQERTLRENFYNDMVWVVDGTRLKRDYPRFRKGINEFRKTPNKGCYIVDFPHNYFPSSWLGSRVPVIFDFQGTESKDQIEAFRNHLYCVLPQRNKRKAVLFMFTRESFIKSILNGDLFKKQQKPQNQRPKSLTKNNIVKRKRIPTHYYDPRKGRLVRKRRF